jgi:hypothetical protein
MVVRHLNAIGKDATFDFACRVGKVVIDAFYAGEIDSWRVRDANKQPSFRKLSRHPELPMSAAALYRSVCIYEICDRLGIRCWKNLSTSHLRLVIPLPPADQERVLRLAQDNSWSVRRLDEEVATMRAPNARSAVDRGGRRRAGHLGKAMRSVENCSCALEELLCAPDDASAKSAPERISRAIVLLRETARRCRVMEERLVEIAREATTTPPDVLDAAGEGM